jgi:hypothetical protein
MITKQVIEWASFRLKNGVTDAELLAASDAMQAAFLQGQKGFIKRELVKAADEQWADVVYWASHADAEAAMPHAMGNAACLKYFDLLQGVDHAHPEVGVLHLNVMKTYE